MDKDNSSPIILAVKSVRVVTPSSKLKPLMKEISKSLVSNDNFFLFFYSYIILELVQKLFHFLFRLMLRDHLYQIFYLNFFLPSYQ